MSLCRKYTGTSLRIKALQALRYSLLPATNVLCSDLPCNPVMQRSVTSIHLQLKPKLHTGGHFWAIIRHFMSLWHADYVSTNTRIRWKKIIKLCQSHISSHSYRAIPLCKRLLLRTPPTKPKLYEVGRVWAMKNQSWV